MIDRLPGATSRRTFVARAVAAVAAGATSTMGMSLYRNRHEVPASYGLTVAMRSATGPWRQTRELVHAADLERVIPGTRVLAGPQQEELLATQEAWLDGLDLPDHVAGTPRDLVRRAALDLWVLSAGLPMAVAGWSPMWRHARPRDTAHVAVALHRLGDAKGATRQLAALASRVGRAGRMQARYALDGGTPDDRPPQDDGFGWALWAAGSTVDSWRGRPTRRASMPSSGTAPPRRSPGSAATGSPPFARLLGARGAPADPRHRRSPPRRARARGAADHRWVA